METTLRRPLEELSATYGASLDVQIALEERMVTLGRDQVRKAIARAKEKGNEGGTSYGKSLIAASVERLSGAIVSFLDKAKQGGAGRRHSAVKYLEQVEPDVAAYISLRLVVDSLTGKKQLLQRVAVHIGKRIEDEARFSKFKETDARIYSRALEKVKKATSYHRKKASMAGYDRRFSEEWLDWDEQDCLHIGACLIDMMLQTGLIEVGDQIHSRRDTVKVLQPTAKLVEWIERETSKSELLSPAHMPMVVPPLPWSDPFNGGYLTADAQGRNALVKTGNMNYLTELADNASQMTMVYDAVNALQNTRWQINAFTHETMLKLWDMGHPVAGLPSRDDVSICACPKCGSSIPLARLNTRNSTPHECFDDAEVLRLWKQQAYEFHAENVSLRSKRLALVKTLKVAEIYAPFEALHIPYQLDFRGRIYAIPTFNPQGNDVTKGLLQFADAMPIEDGVAAGWLAIHGANTYGFDKASLEDRIQWVEDHQQQIVMAGEDPFMDLWWTKADKPWQFLAFCHEWAGFVRQGYGFMSRLAVALDGSCSGIQHFSAMLRDSVGGKAVNLLPSDKPEDIYQRVCDVVVGKLYRDAGHLGSTIAQAKADHAPDMKENLAKAITLQAEAKGEWGNEVFAAGWLLLEPTRKTTKRQVMTLPYGSTRYSCREYTEEWLADKVKEGAKTAWPKEVSFRATQYLSDLIWDSIGEVVVAAREAMDWLQKCAKVVAEEELPVYWTTPVGFRVMQQYKNMTSRRVKTKLGDSVVKLTLAEEQKSIDKRRMANAISPNVVHSMDASHLVMAVAYGSDNGLSSFAVIHDSFGTHAANTHLFAACLKQAFVDLYQDSDVLGDLRTQFLRQVSGDNAGKIPVLPAKGDLDLQEVLKADFTFA